MDSGSSNSQTLLLLQKVEHGLLFLQSSICLCSQMKVSVLCFPTRAVQTASQLSRHHLHDESYPEAEHVPKQSRLRAHVHGQIDHDFLLWQTHTVNRREISVWKRAVAILDVEGLPEWAQRCWCPDRWLHRSECSTLQEEVDWKETAMLFMWSLIHKTFLWVMWQHPWHTLWWLSLWVQEADLQSAACDGRSDLYRPEEGKTLRWMKMLNSSHSLLIQYRNLFWLSASYSVSF